MPIETNLNVSPYYDDFDENKNFHRVVFRPSVAVQARELTQLQTILQNQIERFGDNIYKVGTTIKGCSLTTDYNYCYIKILDNQVNGQPVAMAAYANTLLVQEGSGLQAYVVNYQTGYESLNPDLNTLYIKYINTGSAGEKTFSSSQVINVYDRNRTVESVTITTAGSGYSNNDTITFTSTSGTGAVAVITTDNSGVIIDVSITSKGSGYITAPTATINTLTGFGASLTPVNYIAQITVAGGGYTAPVGIGSAVKTTNGIIYQKGHFIRVDEQETLLQKYSSSPTDVVVGFLVNESIVNSNSDSTLLDLSLGSSNYTAPGANRLKLSPQLVVLSSAAAAANNDFLALLEYQDGKVVKDRTGTQFNSINKELAKRTFEESGNYVLNQFPIDIVEKSGNTTHFDITIGPGVAYIGGNRVEVLNNSRTPVRKSTDTSNTVNHTVSTSYGNYILVKEFAGVFDVKTGSTISIRDTAGTDVTDNIGGAPTSPGSQIGTARIKSIEFAGGVAGTPTCQYRIYLYDIRMSSSRSFKDARSIIIAGTAIADIVLSPGNIATLNDVTNDTLVYPSGLSSVKTFTSEVVNFRSSTNSTFTTGGSVSISFSGGNTLPYSGVLNDVLKSEFIVIPTQTAYAASNKSGTVTVASASYTNVTGTSTAFLTEYEVGDYISIGSVAPKRIDVIYSDTLLGLSTAFGTTVSANTHKICYPAYIPIDFTKNNKNINVTSDTSVTVDLGHSINATATFSMIHELSVFEPAVRTKTLNNPVFVKLSTDKLANTTTGPWCLGIPDALSIEGVYVGSSNSYSNTTTNYVSLFELDNGQKDNFYGLSYLKLKPGSTLSLTSSSCLLVSVKAFTHGSGMYISTESYPVDDATTPLPSNKIRTQDIPVFTSPTSGEAIFLRDAVDFRTIVANTAVLSTTVAGASIDPSSTETPVSGEKFFPSPSKSFESTVLSYLSRLDRVVLDTDGKLNIIEGVPAVSPSAPSSVQGTMDIGIISVAPYPSLSAKEAKDAGRPDLSNSVKLLQTKGYTMKEIGGLEQRIRQLEYYTLLSTLESNTVNITIPSEANNAVERFKNGFFVDSFDTYGVSNIRDTEYKAQIKDSKLTPQLDTYNVDLDYNSTSSSGTVKTGDLVTLSYSNTTLISQPIANKDRTLVEDFWKFGGSMTVVPSFDNYFDTEVTATSAINIDLATPLTELAKATNSALAKLSISSTLVSSVNVGSAYVTASGSNWNNWSQNISNTYVDTVAGIKLNANTVTDKVTNVGDFLTSASINPYVREQQIAFYASGLRPGATHYVFFDSVNLTSSSRPALLSSFNSVSRSSFQATGALGAALVANTTGEIAALINVPGNTFTTGEKEILVMDSSSLASESSATSKAIGKFSSFTMSGKSTTVTFSTRTFEGTSGSIFSSNTYTVPRTTTGKVSWTERWDPLAQTFLVQPQTGGDTIFLTGVDVYFKQKDSIFGVTAELREVSDNGYPTSIVIPFSRVHLQPSQVNTSATAATATTFTFPSPVAVRSGREYALVLTPDANSPEYRIWTAETGVPDVADPSLLSNQSWGLGTMFHSVSGSAFTAVQGEDLKFTVRRAAFSSLSGTAAFNNGDFEFLTTANTEGAFIGGEDIAQMSNSYINTTLTTNTSSRVLTTSSDITATVSANDNILVIYGTNQTQLTANVKSSGTTLTNATSTATSFNTDFAVGDFIRVGSNIRQVVAIANATSLTLDVAPSSPITSGYHYTVAPVFDVLRVTSANSTSVTVNKTPSVSTNGTVVASLQEVVSGTVNKVVADQNTMIIANSSASSDSFKLRAANSTYFGYLVGADSQATAKISSIDNVNASAFIPLVNKLIVPGTAVSLSTTFTKALGGTSTSSYSLSDINQLSFGDLGVVKSKTNEISGSTVTKSLTGTLTLSTGYTDSSPVVDTSSFVLQNYRINNSITNENTRYGSATCKYISKRLILADGLDAEDLRLYVRAYKPAGTEVYVYAKVLNSADGEAFDTKDWSLLQQVTAAGVYSSVLDTNDVREYEYTFNLTPTSSVLSGKAQSFSNSTITGSGTTFNTDLVAGDIVKIVNTSSTTDYDILPVSTVGGATSITLSGNVSFSASGLTIEKVTNPKMAFKYNKNSNIVRYFNSSGAAFDTYKYLAIKVVMVSSQSYLVPKLDDVRAIACSV